MLALFSALVRRLSLTNVRALKLYNLHEFATAAKADLPFDCGIRLKQCLGAVTMETAPQSYHSVNEVSRAGVLKQLAARWAYVALFFAQHLRAVVAIVAASVMPLRFRHLVAPFYLGKHGFQPLFNSRQRGLNCNQIIFHVFNRRSERARTQGPTFLVLRQVPKQNQTRAA